MYIRSFSYKHRHSYLCSVQCQLCYPNAIWRFAKLWFCLFTRFSSLSRRTRTDIRAQKMNSVIFLLNEDTNTRYQLRFDHGINEMRKSWTGRSSHSVCGTWGICPKVFSPRKHIHTTHPNFLHHIRSLLPRLLPLNLVHEVEVWLVEVVDTNVSVLTTGGVCGACGVNIDSVKGTEVATNAAALIFKHLGNSIVSMWRVKSLERIFELTLW